MRLHSWRRQRSSLDLTGEPELARFDLSATVRTDPTRLKSIVIRLDFIMVFTPERPLDLFPDQPHELHTVLNLLTDWNRVRAGTRRDSSSIEANDRI